MAYTTYESLMVIAYLREHDSEHEDEARIPTPRT